MLLMLITVGLLVYLSIYSFVCLSLSSSAYPFFRLALPNISLLFLKVICAFIQHNLLYEIPSSSFIKVKKNLLLKILHQNPQNFPHTWHSLCHFKWIQVKINLTLIAQDLSISMSIISFLFYTTRHIFANFHLPSRQISGWSGCG